VPNQDDDRPKQRTPAGHEIPVPKREEVMRDLRKVANPPKPAPDDGRSEDGEKDATGRK
jgi:hypothetical protein